MAAKGCGSLLKENPKGIGEEERVSRILKRLISFLEEISTFLARGSYLYGLLANLCQIIDLPM